MLELKHLEKSVKIASDVFLSAVTLVKISSDSHVFVAERED